MLCTRALNTPSQLCGVLRPPMQDSSLRHTLQFGIGLHHAGLSDSDRQLVEALYVENKIQVRCAGVPTGPGPNVWEGGGQQAPGACIRCLQMKLS